MCSSGISRRASRSRRRRQFRRRMRRPPTPRAKRLEPGRHGHKHFRSTPQQGSGSSSAAASAIGSSCRRRRRRRRRRRQPRRQLSRADPPRPISRRASRRLRRRLRRRQPRRAQTPRADRRVSLAFNATAGVWIVLGRRISHRWSWGRGPGGASRGTARGKSGEKGDPAASRNRENQPSAPSN